jgi:hypothetical protein
LLVAFGADSSTAVAADLIWRLVWWLPQLIVGMGTMGVYLVGKRRTEKSEGEQVANAPATAPPATPDADILTNAPDKEEP